MKKLLLSVSALFIFGTASAVDYSSIYLSNEAEQWLGSVEHLITITPLTSRIAEDNLVGASYWINPFRNIERSLRSIGNLPKTDSVRKLESFITSALYDLNTRGSVRVYGRSATAMKYFTNQSVFYYGGE